MGVWGCEGGGCGGEGVRGEGVRGRVCVHLAVIEYDHD